MPTVRKKVMGRWVDINVTPEEVAQAEALENMPKPDPETTNQSFNVHEAAELGIHSQQDAQAFANEQFDAAVTGEGGDEGDEGAPAGWNTSDVPAEQGSSEGDVRRSSKK